MYRSLLVPLDGSIFAEHALPLAISIARRSGAVIQVVSVARFSHLSSSETPERWAAAWRAYLQGVVERVSSRGNVSVSYVFLEERGDDAAPIISAHAESIGADLIVMATHGRGALGRFWLGSVPYKLMHRSPLPLLLVRPSDGAVDLGNEFVSRHVLIPLDGSSLSEAMIEPAVALGSLWDGDYTLLHVINSLPLGTPELDSVSLSSLGVGLLDDIRFAQERVEKEAQGYLDGVAERLRARGLKVQTRVTVANDPGLAILDELGAPGVDLVAMETHGRRGLSSLVIGSVARKVVHGTLKPILVQSAGLATHSSG